MRTKFGVRLPVTGPFADADSILRIAVKADELGFDAVTAHDHVRQTHTERYHNSGGVAELVDLNELKGLPLNVFETMSTFSYLAARTRKVRLIPCAAVLPWRNPVLFAKQSVTLQEFSGGRFVSAVVIGRWKVDFEAMNVTFERRGKLMDEGLEIISRIFEGKGFEHYDGKFFRIPSAATFPPVPSKRVPIWIGGSFNPTMLQRLAKYADGILPSTSDPKVIKEEKQKLTSALSERGRNASELEVGVQTFLCLENDKQSARELSRYTLGSFYHGTEFDKPDPNNPSKTLREVMTDEALNSSLVGSKSEVTKRIEEFTSAGANFFDMRLVHKSLDSILEMIERFALDVMPSFN